MEQLDILIDNIEITIKKIELTKISDQEFFQQLTDISTIVTRTNSKLFNIRSDKYYQFYEFHKYHKEQNQLYLNIQYNYLN